MVFMGCSRRLWTPKHLLVCQIIVILYGLYGMQRLWTPKHLLVCQIIVILYGLYGMQRLWTPKHLLEQTLSENDGIVTELERKHEVF